MKYLQTYEEKIKKIKNQWGANINPGVMIGSETCSQCENFYKAGKEKGKGWIICKNIDEATSVLEKTKTKFEPPKVYSEKEIKARWDKKRKAIKHLSKNISRLKTQITKDLSSSDEKTVLIATIAKIIEMTGERVGNEESAQNGHHGISNLTNKHVKINGSTITFNYTGKSGVDHDNSIKNQKIATILKELKKRNKKNLFITKNGYQIKARDVNSYLKNFDITSKDLRGYKANKLMREKLSKLKKTKDMKEIKKNFNETLREVAAIIQHTPSILRSAYLLPEIEETYYKYGSIGYVKKI